MGFWEKIGQLKERLAAKMRARVYPDLLERGFVARRPNRKRAGRFPVNYWRDRGDEYDQLGFDWSMHEGCPRFVMTFEIFRGEENIRALKNQHWVDSTEEIRDIGGRIVARKGILYREIWFRVSTLLIFFPTVVQDLMVRRTVNCALRRVAELDSFMTGDAPFPPSGYNWNMPRDKKYSSNQNRYLTRAEVQEAQNS